MMGDEDDFSEEVSKIMQQREIAQASVFDFFINALCSHLAVNHENFTTLFMASVEDYMDYFKEIVIRNFEKWCERMDADCSKSIDEGWSLEKMNRNAEEIVWGFTSMMLGEIDDEIKSW